MDYTLAIKFIALVLCLSLHLVNGGDESIVIVAIPQTNNETSTSWERGEEILLGAMVASKSINNDSRLKISLKILVVDSGNITSSGYSYSGNVMKVIANLTLQDRLGKITGIAGVLHPNLLLVLKPFQLPTASLVHFGGVPYIPNVFYMTASISVVADSLVALMAYFNEGAMGLITERYHSYYLQVSNQLSKVACISLYIQIGHQSTKHSLSKVTTTLSRSSVKIIFLCANPSVSIQVLCEAYKAGLTWPKYTWILLSFPFNSGHQHARQDCMYDIQDILEGVLILELAQTKSDPLLGENPFVYVLHDAIWELALSATTANHSPHSQLNGTLLRRATGSNVYVYQIFNGMLSPSGVYEGEPQLLVNVTLKGLSIDHFKPPAVLPLHYLMVLPIVCCVFNTMLLLLFICFRNEPDVKSTAVSLSLLMFIGCYLFVVYIIFIFVGESLNLDLCMVRIYGLSLCTPLILATALVKMLRVYRVFTLRGYEKPTVFLYNCALFIYILLIIAPKICIVILWSLIDTYHRKDIHCVDSSGFTVIQTQCRSKYTLMWTIFLAVYDIALSVAVVTIAVRTRKVRFARYKDTKKVNLMVFLVLFVGISTWLYWYVFTATGLCYLLPTYILYAGSITVPFICQFTLFVPKIWTPLCSRLHIWVLILHSKFSKGTH